MNSLQEVNTRIISDSEKYDTQQIYKRIMKLRELKKISINEMLDYCNIHKDTVSKLNRGQMTAKSNFQKIADYLGVSYAYLCGVAEFERPKDETKDLWGLPLYINSINNGVGVGNAKFDKIVKEIADFVGCEKDYLLGYDVDKPFIEPTNDSEKTYEDIIEIFNSFPNDIKYKTVQIRLSAIIKDFLLANGVNQEDLHEKCGFDKGQLEFIFNDKESLDDTVNFGFNISNLMKIRAVYGYSIREMLKGQKINKREEL